jgi:phage repressor protein C with HTH and peptisase S24 domain
MLLLMMDDLTRHRKMRLSELIAGPPYRGSQSEFGKAVGLSKGRITQLLSQEQQFGERSARGICDKLGLDTHYFEAGFYDTVIGDPPFGASKPTTQHLVVPLVENHDYPAIRRVKFKLQAGATGFGVEYLNEDGAPMVFHRDWFTSRGYTPSKLFAVKVTGSSMEPGLFDGDVVVVNTAQTNPKDGLVFAVNYEGELAVKRMHRDGGHWWLRSDNSDKVRYADKQCHDGVHIVGEVVHKQSEHI